MDNLLYSLKSRSFSKKRSDTKGKVNVRGVTAMNTKKIRVTKLGKAKVETKNRETERK